MFHRLFKSALFACLASIGTLLALWIAPALAASPGLQPYRVTRWTSDNGLPQGTVRCLLQTRDGYLWIGTGAGLVRFDGWHFHTFRIGNTPALLDDNCVALGEGADGAVWIGTERGGLLRWENHQFIAWQAGGTNSSLTLAHNQVRALHTSRNGNVWIGTANGLDLFRAGQFTHYTTANGLQANNIRAVLEDAQGAVWVGTEMHQYFGGLQRLEPGANHFETVPGQGTNLPFMVHCFLEDKDGAVWWGNNAGLHRRANGVTRDFHIADGLSGEVVRRLVPAGDGGFLVVNDERQEVRGRRGFGRFKDGQMAAIGLAALGIDSELICALEDTEGNLWLGTRHDGLYRLQRRPVVAFTTGEGLPSDSVNCLCATRDGTVYVATAAGLSAIKDNQVVSNLCEDCAKRITLAFAETHFGWLWRWKRQQSLELYEAPGLKTRLDFDLPTLDDHAPVRCLYADRDDALWVGQGGGATRLDWGSADPSLWKVSRGDFRTNHLGNAPIRVITQDRLGAVWLGTQGAGLLRWRDGNLTSFTAAGGLGSDVVSSLLGDSEGALWIGTDSGLARLKDGHFARVSLTESLPEPVINQILEDDLGQLWCGGPRGIFRVSRAELNAVADGRQPAVRAVTYGEAEGMPSAEVSGPGQPLGGKSPDGRLWFVTLKGVVVIDPRTALDNPVPPPVKIEQVRANSVVVFGEGAHESSAGASLVSAGKQDASSPAGEMPALHFAPGHARVLEIQYTAMHFTAPDKVRFAYQLEGHDPDWQHDDANRRVAFYTDLRPGQYRFHVKACNNHGLWNETGAAFAFVVEPHFYETWLFYGLCVAFVAVSGGLIQAWRLRLQRRILRLEHLHGLDRERARISQDIHDDLGSRLSQLSVLSELTTRSLESPSQARPHLEKLRRTTGEVFQALDEIVWAVNPKQDSVAGLVTYLREFGPEFLSPAGIHCRLDFPSPAPGDPLDSEMRHNLFLVVKEALNNIVKHARATEVWLRLSVKDRMLSLVIEDNGCGFDLAHSALRTPHSALGNGLVNMRERMTQLGGQLTVESVPGQGTRIALSAPL